MKPFDMTTNKFQDDINLGYFIFANGSCNTKRYSTADNRYIIVAFEMNETKVYTKDNRLLTVVYDTEANRVVFCKAEDYREIDFNNYIDVTMKYKDNKLYLLKKYNVYQLGVTYQELRVTVLDGYGTLYDGIITSGTEEDRKFNDTNRLQTALEYREYFNLSME